MYNFDIRKKKWRQGKRQGRVLCYLESTMMERRQETIFCLLESTMMEWRQETIFCLLESTIMQTGGHFILVILSSMRRWILPGMRKSASTAAVEPPVVGFSHVREEVVRIATISSLCV